MHFDRFGRLCTSVLTLLVSLDIDIEIGQEVLHVDLFLDDHKAGFKILGEIYLLLVYLAWRAGIFFI